MIIYSGKRWINLDNVTEIEEQGDTILISYNVAWSDPMDATKTVRDGRTITDPDEVVRIRAALEGLLTQ